MYTSLEMDQERYAERFHKRSNGYVLCRVVMVGEAKVGKTALRRRIELGDNKFGNEYKETIGVDFASRRVNVGFSDEYKREVLLQVFDVGGQPRYRPIAEAYLKAPLLIVLVFDISCHESFREVNWWVAKASHMGKGHRFLLVGTKKDLEHIGLREVMRQEAQDLADELNCDYIETSARDCENIEKLLDTMTLPEAQHHRQARLQKLCMQLGNSSPGSETENPRRSLLAERDHTRVSHALLCTDRCVIS